MKKECNKILILSVILLSLIILNFAFVYADANDYRDTTNGDPTTGVSTNPNITSDSFLNRWMNGFITDRDAKILVWFMTSIVLFLLLFNLLDSAGLAFFICIPAGFILSAFVTPASVIGIIKSYNTLPTVFLTVFPLAILLGITFTSTVKGKRSLMTFSWLLWAIYFLYVLARVLSFLALQNMGDNETLFGLSWTMNRFVFETFTQNIPEWGTQEYVWFWFSSWISLIVAGVMTIAPGWFMNFITRKTLGIEKAVWEKKMNHVAMGLDTLDNIGKRMEGGSP